MKRDVSGPDTLVLENEPMRLKICVSASGKYLMLGYRGVWKRE